MVKFSDAPFRDAYLSSLRKNEPFDSPSPKVAARHARSDGADAGFDKRNEEHSSPILQRAAARRQERQSFLRTYGGEKLEREMKEKEEQARGPPTEHPSRRTRRLWDLDAPAEEVEAERRDESDCCSDLTYGEAGAVWDAARVRREIRRDVTKKAKNDLDEIERFASDMRQRTSRYYTVAKREGAEEDEGRGELEEESIEDKGRKQSDQDIGARVSGGAVLVRAMDDGYGKQVAGRAGSKKEENYGRDGRDIDSLIHKFQTARIRHNPSTREDELMTGDSLASPRRGPTRKAAPYRGINMDEGDGEEYHSTFNRDGYDGGCNARLQRIRERKDDEPEPNINVETEKEERARPGRAPDDSPTNWYEARKRQQQEGVSSGSDRLESWWRVQQSKRNGGGGRADAQPFEELADEPTVEDTGPLTKKKDEGGDDAPVSSRPPLSPMPKSRRARTGGRGDDAGASPSPAAFRARPTKCDAGRGGDPLDQSPMRRRAGRPSPEAPVGSVVVPPRNPRHETPQSAATSFLSEADEETSRCHSVAQSTLSVLLSRLEEARANFARALADGDVARQAELAGLMSRLGEAAVAMRKLEQV